MDLILMAHTLNSFYLKLDLKKIFFITALTLICLVRVTKFDTQVVLSCVQLSILILLQTNSCKYGAFVSYESTVYLRIVLTYNNSGVLQSPFSERLI